MYLPLVQYLITSEKTADPTYFGHPNLLCTARTGGWQVCHSPGSILLELDGARRTDLIDLQILVTELPQRRSKTLYTCSSDLKYIYTLRLTWTGLIICNGVPNVILVSQKAQFLHISARHIYVWGWHLVDTDTATRPPSNRDFHGVAASTYTHINSIRRCLAHVCITRTYLHYHK
jgi:hypothetical protein